MFALAAFAIILDEEGRVLLSHRRDRDLWNLPGGRVELGESPWAGVLREIKEETGLEAEIESLAGVYRKTQKDEVVFSFFCKVVGGELQLTDEADQHEYFALEDIPENTSPKQVERVKDFFTDRGVAHLKEQ